MRLLILIGLIALMVAIVTGRDLRLERKIRKYSILQPKDKRGAADYSSQSFSARQPSYFTPINAPVGGHSYGGSPGDYDLGHAGSSGLESIGGYRGHSMGLGHGGGLNFATLSLGGHGGGKTGYALQPLLYGSSPLLSTSSKTGPVTFGVQGLSAYTAGGGSGSGAGGGHGMNIPIFTLGGHGSTYNLPVASSGYSGSHGLPSTSTGSHGFSFSAPAPLSHATSNGLIQMITPVSSHGSSSSYGSASPAMATSNREPSSSYHGGLSSGSSDSSQYQLPVSSSSYSTDSGSYSAYQPASSEGHSYASAGNSGYSIPNTGYHGTSSSYSSPTYSAPSSSYSNGHSADSSSGNGLAASSSYSHPSTGYSAPSFSYSSSSGYTSHSQPSSVYSSSAEQQGSYSQSSPSYLSYAVAAPKYDTISYSSSSQKY